MTRLLSHRSHPAPRLQYWGQRHRSRGRLRARRHPQGDADHHPGVSHRPRLFAFVSAPIDTHASTPALLCWQSAKQQPRPQGSSRSRQRPQGQLHVAITGVGCSALEPIPKCSPFCQRPLTCPPTIPPPPLVCSLLWNEIGAEGAAALAAILKETNITTLWSAAAPEYPFVSAPLDTSQHLPLPLPPQSRAERTRSRRRSRSRRGPQGQLHTAIVGVGCSGLEPAPRAFA